MTEDLGIKFNNLLSYLKGMNKVAVAFSGGVDSTLLLKAAQMALGSNAIAVSIKTPYIPGWEIEEAVNFTRQHNIKHKVYEYPFLIQLKENPKDRCFICKQHLFKFMTQELAKEGFNTIIEGTNYDDLKDYRPGLQALKDLKITSPLLEVRLTKEEIRRISQRLELPTFDKPAYACLLTRIPYDTEISNSDLRKIEQSEKFLHSIGFRASRVRAHSTLARIEVQKEDFPKIMNQELFHKISVELKAIGYTYVSLDMEGYRMGSYNEAL